MAPKQKQRKYKMYLESVAVPGSIKSAQRMMGTCEKDTGVSLKGLYQPNRGQCEY